MNKFKVGDKVICKRGYIRGDVGDNKGGHGYIKGRIFIINDITGNGYCYWSDGYNGVWEEALKLYNKINFKLI